jgi:hypothetical protein
MRHLTYCLFVGGAGFAGLSSACSTASDLDDTADPFEPPEVEGRYEVTVQGVNGCDANADLLAGWADGPLTIAGEPSALSWDFGDGVVLSGAVDDSYGLQFSGGVAWGSYAIDAYADGVVYSEDDRWVLEGDLEGVVDDNGIASDDCTITGPFKAYQVAR